MADCQQSFARPRRVSIRVYPADVVERLRFIKGAQTDPREGREGSTWETGPMTLRVPR
jgi:hypothetical protein